jgi:two-component system, sensor histidine kinase and response regulator
MRQAMELGADDYLAKPFSNKQLFAAIEARVQKHQSIRKEVEEKLTELRSSISQALPDELSGPIRQIVSMTEFISTGHRHLEQDEIVALTKDVHHSALRLQRLIDNCLLYAELEVLAADPEKVETLRKSKSYVNAVVEPAMFQKARQMQRYADLVLDRTLSEAQVSMSPVYLKKIVDELLDNAFKFSKPGTPVQVKTSLTDTEFILTVIDQGPGMTREQTRKVGAYMQFGRKLHEQHGSGLGLTITKRLTQLHQGKFTVKGEPGQGTTVIVSLPLTRKNRCSPVP